MYHTFHYMYLTAKAKSIYYDVFTLLYVLIVPSSLKDLVFPCPQHKFALFG